MTRTTKRGAVVDIRKRHRRYWVTLDGRPVENTWDLRWALYRWTCCM